MRHNLIRDYSENDIQKLINQGQKKAEYINRIIDSDIFHNMISESNFSLKEKSKYVQNYRNFCPDNSEKFNNNQKEKNVKKVFNNDYDNNNIVKINCYNDYKFSDNVNNNLNNSLNVNKPFHRERRHFPLVNNKGNFFKNITPFLVGNTEELNSVKNQNNNIRYIYNSRNKNNINENNITRYQVEKLRKSNSMTNIPISHRYIRKNLIQGDNANNYSEKMANSMGNTLVKGYKYYNPRRYDYDGSRYGDKTYNYYLNSPMRSDISADWKFPPLYYYNYIPKEKSSNY